MALYNEAVLITPLGSLMLRAGRHFVASRKLGKAHQSVLVFFKGNPQTIPPLDLGEVGGADEEPE